MRNSLLIINVAVLMLLPLICGCSPAQIKKSMFGMTSGDVRYAEKRYERTIDRDPNYCFDGIIKYFRSIGAVERAERPTFFITAYGFNGIYPCIDTTRVGVQIVPVADGETKITVVSGNYYLAEFLSDRIVRELTEEKSEKPEEVKQEG